MGIKISLGSWAFSFGPYASSPLAFADVARMLASAGYDGIEVCGFAPHVTPAAYPSSASRAGLLAMLSDLGLGVSGYNPDLTSVNPVSPGSHDRYLDQFRRNLDLAAAINSPTIRVDTVAAPGAISDSDYHAAFVRLTSTWRACAEYARQAGIRMVWEFEPGFAFNKPSEILAVHERVGHAWFQILFDTAHAYLCAVCAARQHGRPETLPRGVAALLDKLQGRIGALHIVDTDGTLYADETSAHRALGAGLVDFPALVPKLKALPGIEWWCVDLCFCGDAAALAPQCRASLARLLAPTPGT